MWVTMETIAGPVFRFSTRCAAAFSHGFDVARIGTGSPHRSDRRFIKHSDIRVRGFFGPVTALCPPREPRGTPIEIQFASKPKPIQERKKQYAPIYYRNYLSFPVAQSVLKKKNDNEEGNEISYYNCGSRYPGFLFRACEIYIFFFRHA